MAANRGRWDYWGVLSGATPERTMGQLINLDDRRGRPTPVTAFVLAGGSSLGAMQAGMLRALYEREIQPDMLVGTSAGAINASYVASRPQTVETANELAAIWRDLRRHHVFPIHARTLVGGLRNRAAHLVPDGPLRRQISRQLDIDRLEQASVPVHLVCLDVLSGDEVRLAEGPALEAVLAAAAIPGVFPPVEWDGRLLVDGGVVNNTPISHAVELGAERIYVLPTGDAGGRVLSRPPQTALEAALYAIDVMTGKRLEGDLARYADQAELVVLPAANPGGVRPTDFDHAEELVAAGLREARVTLRAAARAAPRAA